MVIAHHELVARQRIERVLELLRLGDGKVAGVHHAVELPLQQRLAGGFGQKPERLGQHERKGDRQESRRTCRRASGSGTP